MHMAKQKGSLGQAIKVKTHVNNKQNPCIKSSKHIASVEFPNF